MPTSARSSRCTRSSVGLFRSDLCRVVRAVLPSGHPRAGLPAVTRRHSIRHHAGSDRQHRRHRVAGHRRHRGRGIAAGRVGAAPAPAARRLAAVPHAPRPAAPRSNTIRQLKRLVAGEPTLVRQGRPPSPPARPILTAAAMRPHSSSTESSRDQPRRVRTGWSGLCGNAGLIAFDQVGRCPDCCEHQVVACPGVGVDRGVGQLDDVFIAVVGSEVEGIGG